MDPNSVKSDSKQSQVAASPQITPHAAAASGVRLADGFTGRNKDGRVLRRKLVDRSVRGGVFLGGWFIISIIVLLISVLLAEVLPIFSRPRAENFSAFEARSLLLNSEFAGRPAFAARLAGPLIPAASSADADGKTLAVVFRSGIVAIFRLGSEPKLLQLFDLFAPADPAAAGRGQRSDAQIQLASASGNQRFSAVTTKGELLVFSYSLSEELFEGRTVNYVRPKIELPIPLGAFSGSARRLAVTASDRGEAAAILSGRRDLVIASRQKKKGLVGGGDFETKVVRALADTAGTITSILFSHGGSILTAGTDRGELLIYELPALLSTENNFGPPIAPAASAQIAPADGGQPLAVTALTTIGAGRNIIAGDSRGRITEWGLLAGATGKQLALLRDFASLPGPITAFAVSNRLRVAAALSADGEIELNHTTSGKTLIHIEDTAFATGNEDTSVSNLTLLPRGNRLTFTDYSGKIFSWELKMPYPDLTIGTLLQPTWYEDYPQPEYVWQSGGGSDLVEPKFSLIPLIFGTVKATFYALLLSVPLALIAALYTSQFLDPRIRKWVKPAVELMSAVPSVVIGLIAGLWLAPRIELVLAGILVLPVAVPLLIILARLLIKARPGKLQLILNSDRGLLLLVPLTALAVWGSLQLGPLIESAAFGGDLRGWAAAQFGLHYDQRNCIVVGIAMGFAVIPLIFTVAEDVLSAVPRTLVAGSLALGATRWETAVRIVLPTASPGLFAAIMLGLGRAIGETMIVLMATGNTPLLDFSPFNGLRALSANIAVELPEAPVGSSLYRVLFLTALLLFFATFAINTLSEMIRIRLRRRYNAG